MLLVVLILQLLSSPALQSGLEVSRRGSDMLQLACTENGAPVNNVEWRRIQHTNATTIISDSAGVLSFDNLSTDDEGFYQCCRSSDNCSPTFPFLVPLMTDTALPLSYSVYIQSALELPCGVLYGSLTTLLTVSWTVFIINPEQSTTVVMYNSTPTTSSSSDGIYRYNTTSSALHIANFTSFEDLEDKRINLICRVCRARDDSCEDHTTRITILSVSFLLPLKPAMVTNMSMVRLHVRAQASGGVAHVSWMVRGKEVSSGARYVIYTDPGPHNTTFSTLAISGVSDADTRSEVTAIASFRNKTDFSTTQLIRVPTLENLTVNCNGVFLVQFDLPETFPLFRELNGIMAVNITLIFMFCHVTDIQNTFNSTISISASNYRDLTSHGVYLNREHFPSDGRYRLQARLSINGQEVQEFSSLCNRERNVYPSTTDCMGEALIDDITEELHFDLSFEEINCHHGDVSNGSVSEALHTTLSDILVNVCFDLITPTLTCHDDTSATFTTSLLTFSDRVSSSIITTLADHSIISVGSFDFTVVSAQVVTTPTPTPTPGFIGVGESVCVSLAGVVMLVVLVVGGVFLCKTRQRRRCNAAAINPSSPPQQDP